MPEEITRRVLAGVWDMGHADLTNFRGAADSWETMGGSLRSRADTLVERGATLLGSDWSGDTRNSYEDFQKRLVASLDEAADLAEEYGSRLRALADTADSTREALATNLDLILDLPASREFVGASYSASAEYVFTFAPELAERFEELVSEARTLNQDFFSAQDALDEGILERWSDVAQDWEGVGLGTTDPFLLPEAPPGTQVLIIEGEDGLRDEIVVNTGPGDDHVQVTYDGDHILVTINGVVHTFPAYSKITIRGGEGDDHIEGSGDPPVTPTFLGGDGDDTIAVTGHTPVAIGGKGNDVILGNYTGDYLSGGSGDDYIEGREGEDVILAGSGGDTIYAGDDFDIVSNPEGSSYIDTGSGHNRVYSGESAHLLEPDTFVATDHAADVLGDGFVTPHGPTEDIDLSFLNIEGSPEFVARVEADMRTLSRYMGDVLATQETPLDGSSSDLSRLSHHQNGNFWGGGHTITIREAPPDSGFTVQRETSTSFWGNRDTVINYNPVYNGPHEVAPAEGYRPAEYGSPAVQLAQELQAEGEEWGDW